MSFVLSPNMNLSIPTVGQEAGPQYAFDVNSSLTLIDSHDHSPGKGIAITPAGININAALTMQNNNLIAISNLIFTAQSASTNLQALYVLPGSESPPINDLWYNDSNGTAIQITSNGGVNATAASIPGESYAAGTFFWKQTQSGGPTTPANFDIGSITLRPNTALTTNGITLSPPSSIASAYTITLPSLPAGNSFLTMNSSGIISTIDLPLTGSNIATATITGSNIAAATVTKANQVAVGQQTTGSQTGTQTSTTLNTDLPGVTITTSGRPVILMVVGDGSASGGSISLTPKTNSTQTSVSVTRGVTSIGQYELGYLASASTNITQYQVTLPIMFFDTPSAGTYTYTFTFNHNTSGGNTTFTNIQFIAYEL